MTKKIKNILTLRIEYVTANNMVEVAIDSITLNEPPRPRVGLENRYRKALLHKMRQGESRNSSTNDSYFFHQIDQPC